METWDRLTAVGGEEEDGDWLKEGEGSGQYGALVNMAHLLSQPHQNHN